MAERITGASLPFDRSHEDKFPYDEWFDGSVWKLDPDTDFPNSVTHMRCKLREVAQKRGLKLRTSTLGGGFYIQAIRVVPERTLLSAVPKAA